MATITFIFPDGSEKTVEAPLGYSVMEVAQLNKIDQIEGACGGSLACATCHVYIHPDWQEKCLQGKDKKTDEEEDMLDLAFDVRSSSRLSCQIVVTEALDGLVLALPGSKVEWAA